MLRRPICRAIALLALAILGGTLGCPGKRRGPPPERFVPAAVRAAVVVPEAGRAAQELADLHATVSGFPGTSDLAAWRGALSAQLGFDPLDPEALADAGVDARGGAAAAFLDRPGPKGEPGIAALVVLPASDVPKIERLLARLAKDRVGATERAAEARGGVSPVTFRRPGAPAPSLTYVVVDSTVLLSTDPGGPALVAEAATLAPAASLAEAADWKLARAALGPRPSAIAWLPKGSRLLQGVWALADGAAVAVSTGMGRLQARLAMLLGGREASFRALAATGAAAAQVARLDPEAPLVARFDGDFETLGKKLVPIVSARSRAALAKRGVDLERDLFGLLAPGAALALQLPAHLSVTGLDMAATRADPLRAAQFEAILPLRPGVDPGPAIDRLARLVGPPRRSPDGTARVSTPSGEIAWLRDPTGARLLVAGGRPGRLDALAARAAGEGAGWKPPTPAAEAALQGGLGGAALDAPRLVAGVRELPDEAFGTGPSGFVMRSLVDRIVEPAARLAAISLRAELAPGAMVVELTVEARSGGGEASR